MPSANPPSALWTPQRDDEAAADDERAADENWQVRPDWKNARLITWQRLGDSAFNPTLAKKLAIQLLFVFEMCAARFGLVGASPE